VTSQATSPDAYPDTWDEARASEIIADLKGRDGPLLPILHAIQQAFGCVPEAAEPLIAAALNVTRAEVHGVVTFYHDFRRAPAGRHILKVCRAEACQSMGADALVLHLERSLGLRCGESSADGQITVEAVYCLGLCAVAPSAMLDGALVGRLNERKVDTLMNTLAMGAKR
jgi:formate dehydrogenase subunit gamma